MTLILKKHFQEELKKDDIQQDHHQIHAIDHFQHLFDNLIQTSHKKSSFLSMFKKTMPVPGIYLYGGVGRGKTYLTKLFFDNLPIKEKTRVHFHDFMRHIHRELEILTNQINPLQLIAKNIARKYKILYLDEFHVNDISDAMILAELLKSLFYNGVTLVTTSNIAPDDLYKDGLQRDRFIPAINEIKSHTHVIHLNGSTDYRKKELGENNAYFLTSEKNPQEEMETLFHVYANTVVQKNIYLKIAKREISIRALSGKTIWFDFDIICSAPRSSTDYIEIIHLYDTILISDVLQMNDEQNDKAQRFIQLIDILYDHQKRLILSAETTPESLYQGRRLAFPFQRTVSRLHEMRTPKYREKYHHIH